MDDQIIETKYISVENSSNFEGKIREAAKILLAGGIVAFPTETVYGLGANMFDENAVRKIFMAKNRPADDPLIVHVSGVDMVRGIVEFIPATGLRLMSRFWPGPLSLIFKKSAVVPDVVTAGLPTVAIRMPSHPVALKLIEIAGVPIAAPSANLFEKSSPTKASHVMQDLSGRIDAIIDGGTTNIGIESTILDLTSKPPVLLRPGGIPLEALEEEIGEIALHPSVHGRKFNDTIISPGMKSRHYAPNAMLILIEKQKEDAIEKAFELASEFRASGKKVAILLPEKPANVKGFIIRALGSDDKQIARNLFDLFRQMDEEKVDLIIACGTREHGLGLAIMNRLRKAAWKIVK
ncbi:MAG: L-threonylcarbamoyladenylate synthase [Promethearchaeota archaeon]